VSVVVVTTISCDAAILLCSSCQAEVATASAVSDVDCRLCGGTMQFERRCETGFSLHRDAILIRTIAENKKDGGWLCEQRGGGRDFCPAHVHLANPARVAQPTPRAVGDR
jgi:hypothetical protein